MQELGLLHEHVTRGCTKRHVALDGDAAFNARIDRHIDKEVLVIRFHVVDGCKVRGHEVLGVEVDALGAEFGEVHVDNHCGLLL